MDKPRQLVVLASGVSSPRRAAGGKARANSMTPDERRALARGAAAARWGKARKLDSMTVTDDDDAPPTELSDLEPIDTATGGAPEASYRGVLRLLDLDVPCYVLSDGQRVIGRTSATELLTGFKGQGAFENYLGRAVLKPFIDVDRVRDRMVPFRLPEVEGLEKGVKGLPADVLIEVCQGLVAALEAHTRPDSGVRLTPRQLDMALKASMFLSACAKVGLDSLIDEATGYQYERAQDALEVKLRAYLEPEMRKWEKTFPDELWVEFGRLTGWSKSVTQRPKYWGKLVMELVYEYLDSDVAQWLREHAPKPRYGQNYHLWLTSQYGLRKLHEHIWKLIGVAQTCRTIVELKDKMAQLHGRMPVQYRLYLPYPGEDSHS